MERDDLHTRYFGAFLVAAPIVVAAILSAAVQQPRAGIFVLVAFLLPMALGLWLLTRKRA